MGDFGSYSHEYKLNQDIPELEGVDVVLDGRIDDFSGDCIKCGKFFDIGAKIAKGKVIKIWFLKESIPQATFVKPV